MIDKKVKRKIESKEELSIEELTKYFSHLPAPIEKRLFKKFRQRRAENTHAETQQYLLDNFDAILESMSAPTFTDFCLRGSNFSHQKELLQKLAQNNPRIVEIFNSQYGDESAQMFNSLLTCSRDAHIFFETNFKQFYENTNQYQFRPSDFFTFMPLSEEIRPLILSTLCECAADQTIRKEDIPFFLHEYIYSQTCGERVFWNEIRTPISKIPEAIKSKIQEAITPETALYLVQSTDQPLYVRQLLQSVGLDSPEIAEHIDTHLDDIVQEVSNHSRDSLTIKMIMEELIEHEGVKPSDIEYSAKGGFGKVFKIGDKVLKYGRRAHNAELPYNSELFLQPLLRQTLSGTDFLEIYEQVDVGGSREDMYQLYKALREQGLVWTDIKPGNFGRLRKPNTVHFEGIDSVSHRAVGFREDKEIPIAQPGDFVLIDLDFVFLEGTPYEIPTERTAMNNFHEFSARYKREKEAEQNQTKTIDKKVTHNFDEI